MIYTIYLNTFNELEIKLMDFDKITKNREGYAPRDLKFGVSFFVKSIDKLGPDEIGLNRVATHIYKNKIYGDIFITVEDLEQEDEEEDEEDEAPKASESADEQQEAPKRPEDLRSTSESAQEEQEEQKKLNEEIKRDLNNIIINSYNEFGKKTKRTIEQEIKSIDKHRRNLKNTLEYYYYLKELIKDF